MSSATGSPKRVTRTGFPVLRTLSSTTAAPEDLGDSTALAAPEPVEVRMVVMDATRIIAVAKADGNAGAPSLS